MTKCAYISVSVFGSGQKFFCDDLTFDLYQIVILVHILIYFGNMQVICGTSGTFNNFLEFQEYQVLVTLANHSHSRVPTSGRAVHVSVKKFLPI